MSDDLTHPISNEEWKMIKLTNKPGEEELSLLCLMDLQALRIPIQPGPDLLNRLVLATALSLNHSG